MVLKDPTIRIGLKIYFKGWKINVPTWEHWAGSKPNYISYHQTAIVLSYVNEIMAVPS